MASVCDITALLDQIRGQLATKASNCEYSEPLPENYETLCGDGDGLLNEYYSWLLEFISENEPEIGTDSPDPGPPEECDISYAYLQSLSDYINQIDCTACPVIKITSPVSPHRSFLTVSDPYSYTYKRTTKVEFQRWIVPGNTWVTSTGINTDTGGSWHNTHEYAEDVRTGYQRAQTDIQIPWNITWRLKASNDDCVVYTPAQSMYNNDVPVPPPQPPYEPGVEPLPCTPGYRRVIYNTFVGPGHTVNLPTRRGSDYSRWEMTQSWDTGAKNASDAIQNGVLINLPAKYTETSAYGVQIRITIIC